jgi:hypothetical protein
MWCIGRFILALKHNSYLGSQPSKHLSHRQFTSQHILFMVNWSLQLKLEKIILTWPLASNTRHRNPSKLILLRPASAFYKYQEKQPSVLVLDINMVQNCRFRNSILVTWDFSCRTIFFSSETEMHASSLMQHGHT